MPTVNLSPTAKQRFFDANGVPLGGGKLFTYGAGGTTKQNTYTDSTGNTANANPIILDSAGYCNIWLDQTLSYKFTLSPSTDTDPPTNPIWTIDQIVPMPSAIALAGSGGSGLIGFIQAGTGAVAETAQKKMREIVSVTDFGAVGDAAIDGSSGTPNLAAFNAATAASRTIYIPPTPGLAFGLEAAWYTRGAVLGNGTYVGIRVYGAGEEASCITALNTPFTDSYLMHIGNKDYDGVVTKGQSVQNQVSDLRINGAQIPDDTSHSILFLQGTYNNDLRNLYIGASLNPHSRWDLNIANGTLTTVVSNVNLQQLEVASSIPGNVTTICFYGGSATFVNVDSVNTVHFDHYVVQGDPGAGLGPPANYQTNRVQINASRHVSYVRGDIEGNGLAFQIAGSTGVNIEDNDFAFTTTYNSGASHSQIFSVVNSDKVTSKGNQYPNWGYTDANYFIDRGGNQRLRLYDFAGDYFTGVDYVVNPGAPVAMTNSAATVVNFDQKVLDTGNYTTTGANWVFTAPVPGTVRYNVNANVTLAGLALGNDEAYLAIFANGVEAKRAYGNAPNTGGHTTIPINCDISVSQGKTVQAKIVLTGTSSVTIPVLATASFINIKYLDSY